MNCRSYSPRLRYAGRALSLRLRRKGGKAHVLFIYSNLFVTLITTERPISACKYLI